MGWGIRSGSIECDGANRGSVEAIEIHHPIQLSCDLLPVRGHRRWPSWRVSCKIWRRCASPSIVPTPTDIMLAPSRPLVLVGLAIGAMLLYRTTAIGVAQQPPRRSGLAFDRALPEMDGKKLIMKVVDIHVPPGAKSTPHTHGCAVVVYVISGAMRMQVRGEPDSVYRAGGTFYERPTDVHQLSDNASATDSAHFTATLVCDHVGPLTTPVPPA